MTDDATRAQNLAADPRVSTWLSANAGSGKTRVLTDRVARLLLAGTEPQNILCLTYTKAAASEMQNRLFKRLGEWSMLDDASLRARLAELGETPPDSLSRARTLFARAVETPGGLKIQTIHSFCSAVLRQFPLEAGVSPQFVELDEYGQRALIDDVLDQVATRAPQTLAPVARIYSENTLTGLALAVSKCREDFSERLDRAQIFGKFNIPATLTEKQIIATALHDGDLAFLKGLVPVFSATESANDLKLCQRLADLPDTATIQTLEYLETFLLTGPKVKGTPYAPKIGTLPTKGFREGAFQPYAPRFNDIMQRVADARQARVGLNAATKTAALHEFAHAFLPAYAAAKEDVGALDFEDLILKTAALLTTRSLEWVLYRLDGGIEHILVDEAQDTSPPQWRVIDALAREIMSGEGARPGRTLFVVGDKKQSIYSFQGADARAFDRMKELFGQRLGDGSKLQSRDLLHSFRSSAAILDCVDQVFGGAAGRGLGHDIRHRPFKDNLPGRVDLWPLVERPDKTEKPEWYDPVDRLAADDPRITLADNIAEQIAGIIGTETITDKNGQTRLARPGDILILVQGRSELFTHIIRACKARNLDVAGADRLKIAGELAVKDLLALLSFLALQEDSLSLAAALRSPLFGWSEKSLYDLAQGRRQPYLWAELRDRQADFPDTVDKLNALLRQVDFLRPYELLELVLTRFDGRRNLLARLGPEAEDGIDELLNQAIAFERDAVPSLTGFLTRARSEDVEIKRQSDSSGNLIRVMTVHGAKGLESPIVILPDTTRPDKAATDPILKTDDGTPVWRVPAADCPESLYAARDAAAEAEREERQRLLYVAMTRAETWLIVCGVDTGQKSANWYTCVEDGFQNLTSEPINTPTGQGRRFGMGTWPVETSAKHPETVTDTGDLPDFLTQPARAPAAASRLLSPSDLGGEKVLGGGARAEEAALRHGRQIHRLLEILPGRTLDRTAALRLLASGEDPASEDRIDALFTEALQTIERHPDLFTPNALAEVDVSAWLPTPGTRMLGVVDRLLVTPSDVTAVDFKTNAVVPDTPEDVPDGILRQMGAYLEALEQIFPDRRIDLQIVWTHDASRMSLPHAIVRNALARAPTS